MCEPNEPCGDNVFINPDGTCGSLCELKTNERKTGCLCKDGFKVVDVTKCEVIRKYTGPTNAWDNNGGESTDDDRAERIRIGLVLIANMLLMMIMWD
jgi:hypothetical protein